MSPRRRLGVVASAVAVAVGLGSAILIRGGGSQADSTSARTSTTAKVERGDLVDTATVDGTLTYAARRRIAAAGAGVLTAVPAAGTVIGPGRALYEVDRRPTVLLTGRIPLYRTLEMGVNGLDVKQLQRALGTTVDGRFTWDTARAVRRWQQAHRLERTGSVDDSQVVFLPARVRVLEAKVAVGDRVSTGSTVLTVAGVERVVHVDLDVGSQTLARKGKAVTVELPGGERLTGRIASIGTIAKKKGSDDSAQGPQATLDLDIVLPGGRSGTALDQAPVTVTLERERRRGVLMVPVEALLALREGGYGVEVVDPRSIRRLLAVTTGAYGGGRVEISGPGLAAGMTVGMPAR